MSFMDNKIIYNLRGYTMQSEDKIKLLNDAIKISEHSTIYQHSKQLLKEQPDDLVYQQCFILSAIKTGKHEEVAQNYFKTTPNAPDLQQLYAYFLYDRGEFSKTIQYINSIKNNASLKLLLAQAHFRAFNYAESAELMLALLKDSNLMEQEKEEYIINLMATGLNRALSAQIVRSYEKAIITAERKELLYNYSLVMHECGDSKKSLQYLSEFEKSLTEGKDYDDLASVRLFRDFVEWSIEKTVDKNISEQYEKMLGKHQNKNVKAVLHNNSLFFRQGQNIEHTHEVLRMFDQCLESEYKLTKKQRNIMSLNKLSVLLRKGKYSQAQKMLKQLEVKEQLIRDINFIKNQYFLLKKCKDPELGNFIKKVGKFDSQLAYCLRVDSEKERGAQTELISDLKTKSQEMNHPIIKKFLFSLLIKHSTLFEQYSDYLSEMAQMTKDASILNILLNIYENKKDIEKQKSILTKLLSLQPKDPQIKVKIANIYLEENRIQEAEEVLRGIQAPEELGDIAYLQFIEKNMHVSTKQEDQVKQQIKQNPSNPTKKRIKKKKRVRLPKNMEKYVENYKGDPERWLPKWQRRGYKKKGKKGAGKTQGLATVGRQEKNVYAANTSTSNREVTKEAGKKKK